MRGLIALLVLLIPAVALPRVVIDITTPGFKRLPVAVYDLIGDTRGISGIVREDLQYSGVFEVVDKDAYVESPYPVFKPTNWLPLGVEMVVKGSVVEESSQLKATVHLYDVVEAKRVYIKTYRAEKVHLRYLAHTIADDIYRAVTGQGSVFRSKIAFIREFGDGTRGVFVMDWDGKRMWDTGVRTGMLLSLHWSPDQKRLIYSSERGKKWGIYMIDFERKRERAVFVSKGVNIAGDFLPSSDAFLFSSSLRGNPDLYIYSLREKKARRLTRRYSIEVSPSVSPDGKRVVFVSDHSGTPQVYVMNIDGSGLRRVTFSGSYNTSPVWSPRGDLIAYVGMVNGRNQIFLVRPDGTGVVQLTDGASNEDPSFSPDGRFIAFTSYRDNYRRVYIMRTNGEGQKPLTPEGMRAFGPSWRPEAIE